MGEFEQTPQEPEKLTIKERLKRFGSRVIEAYIDAHEYNGVGYPSISGPWYVPPVPPENFKQENERPYDPELDDEFNIERGRE